MAPQELGRGTLVRYDETTTRWFIGTVRNVGTDTVKLDYLGGYEQEVDRRRVRPLHDVLRGRARVLSLKREDLCAVFYGQSFDRLPQERLDEMQGLLRSHGLRYRPEVWPPGGRIQIDIDDSFVAKQKSAIDKELAALLPRWLQPNKLPPGSRDPLGLQSHAERLANEILPGLTVTTSRIGYYGFIAWAVRRLNDVRAPTVKRLESFHRLERTLALCEFVRHGQEDSSCVLLGQRSKTQILQSAANNRFRVPPRILKNQASAGAFRIYATSLESMGFATQAPELAADGLLPLRLTDLGEDLAGAFEKRVPNDFWDFAHSDKTRDRDTLRGWGNELCFSRLATKAYRKTFLDGFLFGGTREAEARHHTVRMLFQRGLLRDSHDLASHRGRRRPDAVSEDDLAGLDDEDPGTDGVTNREVLLRFYREKPTAENALLQKSAVFELLSLAQTAIFAHIIHALESGGRTTIAGLSDSIVSDHEYGRRWKMPFTKIAAKVGTAADLEDALLDAEDPASAAALGGVLMARVQADPAFASRASELAGTPVMTFLKAVDPGKSLAVAYAELAQAMVDRHEQVSRNKNRQRWCYLDGDAVVRDDLRPIGYGWHAMRFPQLSSLCRDLGLKREEVSGGR